MNTLKSLRHVIIMFVLAAVFGAGALAVQAADPKVVRFGLIPADDATEMLRNYEPVRQYLTKTLGIPVELKVTMDYNAAIEAMRAKHIEMAWFGPFSYVLAAEMAGAEALANGVRRDTGTSTYKTIFVTHKDSGIKSLKDLKGRSIAFVDPASTSGYLIPMSILRRNGYTPEKDFKATVYAGTHNAVQLAVKNRKVDVGADSDTSFARMVKAGEIDPKINLVIHESDPIPGSPIVIRGDLDPAFKKRVLKALLDMDEQTIFQVRGWGDISRYQPATDREYDVIRDVAKILNLNLRKAK
jgi:phosphonate transport system substrate-binding protein